MPTIKDLRQTHPSLQLEGKDMSVYGHLPLEAVTSVLPIRDVVDSRLADLHALYEGDKLLSKRLHRFLIRRELEKQDRYAMRCQEFHYRNYIGPIIDFFASLLFSSRPIAVAKPKGKDEALTDPGDYYNALREDCDRAGADIDAFFKDRLTDAMVGGRSWFRVKQPSDDAPDPMSLSEFNNRKLGDCWLSRLHYSQVLDWEKDDDGNLEWVIIHHCTAKRDSLVSSRERVTETWEHITRTEIDTYSISYNKLEKPSDSTEVPQIDSQKHTFGRVPVVCFELKPALWVASRLRLAQLAHFRSINAQSWSLSATCYAMPVAKVKDPAAFKEVMGAGYGIVIGEDEDWGWEAPPSAHFAALDTEIKAHKDEIFRIAQQLALGVENNAAAVGRSAESKAADSANTRVVLLAFARAVKEVIEYTYDLISRARGEDYEWSVSGLDDFASADLPSLFDMLESVDKIGGIPSTTFNVEMKTRVAEALLPDISQELKAKIREEIEEGVEEQKEADDEMMTAMRDAKRLQQVDQMMAHGGREGAGQDRARGVGAPPVAASQQKQGGKQRPPPRQGSNARAGASDA